MKIQHHGILGMKWGVRRTPEQLGHRTGEKRSFSRSKTKVRIQEIDGKTSEYTVAGGSKSQKKLESDLKNQVDRLISTTGARYKIRYDPEAKEYVIYKKE